MSLYEIAIKRPSLVIVIFSVLFLGGLISYSRLSYELLPDFAAPTITVSVPYPGASPSEVENSVTKKMEDAIASLDNVDEIQSKSLEGISILIVNFNVGTDIDQMIQEAQRKINNVLSELPDDAEAPSISKVSPSDIPIMQLTATSSLPGPEFYTLMDDRIVPQLQRIKGVGEITLLGGEEREIRVNADNDKLKYYGISLLQLNQTIAQANIDVPTGKVKTDNDQVTVRLSGKFASMEDIQDLIVRKQPGGGAIRVGDVAEVTDGVKETSSVNRYNGTNGVGLLIKKQSDANAVDISEEVRNRIAEIEKTYASQKVRIIVASDDSEFTLESVEAVQHDLVIAIILVAVIMLLFLHSIRNALIVMVTIPASLISSFIAMGVLGYSLNLMTLLAMSLVVGILVDDAIVVLENIQKHLEMGKDKRQATLDGMKEIGFAAVAITFVIVVVFLPIVLFVNTTVGDILRQFSVMVVISTLLSLFASFTITPWLTSRFGKLEHLNPKNPFGRFLIWFEKGLDRLTEWYIDLLKWGLHHKILAAVVVVLLFVLTGMVMSLGIMGQEFVAEGDQGKFSLRMRYDKNIPVTRNSLVTRDIENYLLSQPEVSSVFANVGGPSVGFNATGQGSPNVSDLTIELVPAEERKLATEDYMIQVREILQKKYPGIEFGSSKVGISNQGAPIDFVLTGADYNQVIATGQKLKKVINTLPGANDVQVSVEEGSPEVNISIDRKRLADLGLDMQQVGATLQTAFTGNDQSTYRDGGNEFDIRVMMDAFDRKNPKDVANISFVNSRGELVKLAQFATITQSSGPSQLERVDRVSSLSVTAYNLGTPESNVTAAVVKAIEEQKLIPPGVKWDYGYNIKQQNESFGALGFALLIALVLVYLIMVALYDNFVYPFVVLFSIPVALVGAFLALNLAMSSFSIFTMLGIIMLLGLVAKNAILLVDFTNQRKVEGENTYQALIDAGRARLRPILMTTIAMVVGMLPIAIAKGAGAEWKNGLALVIMGGLLSSMMLTVFVVPIAYQTVDLIGDKINGWLGKRGKQKQGELVPAE